jgi:hypothetical protein
MAAESQLLHRTGAQNPSVRAAQLSPPTPPVRNSPFRRAAERWFASPLRIGVTTGFVASCFAVLRFAVAARGNIAGFIIVGGNDAQRSRLPHGVPVHPGSGYDGEFYYRLALNPLAWGHWAFGITLDSVYRIDRIGYPALAWLAAGGHRAFVPATLVLVNVVALGVLGGLGAALARDAGRAPLWGLVFAGYWGLLWSLSRDLTEVVTAAALVGGLLALRRDRPWLAASALTIAVLSRESALVLVAALALARLIDWTKTRAGAPPPRRALPNRPGRTGLSVLDVAWALPLLAFAAWQGALYAKIGILPLTASRGSNAGVPFVGLARGFAHYLRLLPTWAALLWFGELTLLVTFGVIAALSYRSTEALLHERLAWAGYGLLAIALAPAIWLGDVGFRSLDEFYVFSWVLLIGSRRPLRIPVGLVALAWLVVCVELVVNI